MNAILLVLRTGMQWNALNATGICSCSSAYRRFREWAEAGVFLEFWRRGLLAYDGKQGIEWEWLAMDGALGKAPLGGELTGPNPLTELKRGETIAPHRGQGRPDRDRAGGRERERLQARAARRSRAIPIGRRTPTAEAAAGPLPRPRLRLRRGPRPGRRSSLSRPHPRPRREPGLKREAGFRARRWVVERTHSWLNRFRRILTRWEKRADTYLAMLHLACGYHLARARDPTE